MIQYLRAFAAAAVVFHHVSYEVVNAARARSVVANHPSLAALGACGVDVFFVISGFIIFFTMTAESGHRQAALFIANRFLRVVPLYWVWTSLLVAAIAFRLAFANQDFSVAAVASSYLLIPYEKGPGNYHPILDPGWTLSFEMYFYAAAALLIGVLPYRRRLAGLFVVLATVQLTFRVVPAPEAIRQWLASPLVYEFLAGATIAAAARSDRFRSCLTARPRLGVALLGLGAACLGLTMLLNDAVDQRLALWGIPSTMLVLGAVLANAPARTRITRLLFRLGTASYSLYLTHAFATILLGAALKRGHLLGIDPDLLIVGATIAIVALGSATYVVVERPLLALLRGRRRPAFPLPVTVPVPTA